MDGKQQAPQKETHKEEKSCMCSKDHLHESNGCPKCCGQNGSNVVQVSILQEVSPNKRKRNKAFGIVKIITALILFMFWEMFALYGSWQIEYENIYLCAFYTIANFSFVAVAGWYLCGAILDKFAIMK